MDFNTLAGGLNLRELDYRLSPNESPEMKNLMWRDGALNCRDGQRWLIDEEPNGVGVTSYDRLFYDCIVYHTYHPDDGGCIEAYHLGRGERTVLKTGLTADRGQFFQYNDKLYYKATGSYVVVYMDGDQLVCEDVEGYTPVLIINADPETTAGTYYQPENRLSPKKTVWYNAKAGAKEYHLPVTGADLVKVEVDGEDTTAYTYNAEAGVITFDTAPPVTNPPTNNTVRVTYSLENETAYNNIMDCTYACTYGGVGDLCIVMAGSRTQPNAYFWNGNDQYSMRPDYFPIDTYQLCGSTDDPITGFGKQQGYLIIFNAGTVGRTSAGTATVNDRTYIDLPYTPINAKCGCDLPYSIQLVENNLVWANKAQGVMMLQNTSAAFENNIICLSLKVNTSRNGVLSLLEDLQESTPHLVCSNDDDLRYWLCANGHVWVWDYYVSTYKDPAWFYWDNVDAVSFIHEMDKNYHLDGHGRLTEFANMWADYGGGIAKKFRFATQFFGTYDNLKNVNSVIITSRSDTNGEAKLTYITDYETRDDLTPLRAYHWLLVPRELSYRSLAGRRFANVFRRKPHCWRVKHFTMVLANDRPGEDLSIVSAHIFFNYQGVFR